MARINKEELGVNIEDFVSSFKTKWGTEFNNVSNRGFERTWMSLCATFNRAIKLNQREDIKNQEGQRLVLSPQTGTGKTEGLKHYASMMWNQHPHPYILIVARQTEQCDNIAKEINQYAIELFGMPSNERYAASFHSKQSEVKLDDLKHYKVAVITHEYFYRNHRVNDKLRADKWAKFFYINPFEQRKLLVIDESIDLIFEKQIDSHTFGRVINIVNFMRGWKRYRTNHKFQEEVARLQYVKEALEVPREWDDARVFMPMVAKGDTTNTTNKPLKNLLLQDASFPEVIKALKEDRDIRATQILTGKHDSKNDKAIITELIETIESLSGFNNEIDWLYMSISGATVSWHTAQEAFPKGITAVIMDATAPSNDLYKLYKKYGKPVELIPRIDNVRNYRNVTLNVAYGYNTGKGIDTPQNAQGLIKNLENVLCETDKVLIVCHKDMKPHLLDLESSFEYDVVNWGDLTGKNEWKDCNVCVIYGLNNKPPYYYRNRQLIATDASRVMMSPDDDDIEEEYLGLQQSDLAQEVIQAINRISCRKCVDQEGNCTPSQVFIALPESNKGHFIVDAIIDQMDDIVVDDWELDLQGSKRKLRKGQWMQSVEIYLQGALKAKGDNMKATDVKDHLEVSKDSWKYLVTSDKFIENLRDKLGIIYSKSNSSRFYYFEKV